MKKVFFTLTLLALALSSTAQPRPFEIDSSFSPTLEYLQKVWSGSYDGIEPNSRMILSISRSLTLNTDLTYINKVTGHINQDSEEVLFRYETGSYQYNQDTRTLTYTVRTDSTLDISTYLQGAGLKYAVNRYADTNAKTTTEIAQFTSAANDAGRQWVLFDPQLMSPVDQRQKAVYVMQGKAIETAISTPAYNKTCTGNRPVYYNLNGVPVQDAHSGIFVVKGKKILLRK